MRYSDGQEVRRGDIVSLNLPGPGVAYRNRNREWYVTPTDVTDRVSGMVRRDGIDYLFFLGQPAGGLGSITYVRMDQCQLVSRGDLWQVLPVNDLVGLGCA